LTGHLAPALALLEASGRIGRAAAKKTTPRRGWLVTSTENASEAVEDDVAEAAAAPEDVPEAAGAPVRFPAEVERSAVYLSRKIHLEDTQTRHRVEQILAGVSPSIQR
jgi:hypothetical protein